MNLREYQRALVQASFAAQVSEAELEALGDATRFGLYRTMIRTRLEGMAKVAYRATLACVGEAAFASSFARFLAQHPPTSPLIRDVIADFGMFAQRDAELVRAAAHVHDLLAFEHARWCVAYEPARMPKLGEDGVRELDFDGVPVLNPVLARLSLAHAVHDSQDGSCAARPTRLFVYRPPTNDDLRWYAADALMFALVERAAHVSEPLAASVRHAAEAVGRPLDEALLESLATSLTYALERGVLIGVR